MTIVLPGDSGEDALSLDPREARQVGVKTGKSALEFSEVMCSKNDGSQCCGRFCSKVRCFCGSITSCSYFCLIADVPTELPSVKDIVATMAIGGKVDPLPTEEWQSEIGIFWSPQLASEVS